MPIISVKTHYLEMDSIPNYTNLTVPDNTSIIQWTPSAEDYLRMYHAIGDEWGWTGRTQMNHKELDEILNSSSTLLFQIKANKKVAGFIELEQLDNKVEIKYFGLLKDFIGKGLGGYFLKWGILKAWSLNPSKVWVHTCEYDAPQALDIYQKMGFDLVETKIEEEFYEDKFLEKFNYKTS